VGSKIPNSAISSAKVLAEIHDKSKGEVKKHGRAESQEGCIYKGETDAGCCQAELFAEPGTDTESPLLKKKLNSVHHDRKVTCFWLAEKTTGRKDNPVRPLLRSIILFFRLPLQKKAYRVRFAPH
jgi:hypothetical protein